LLVDDLTRLVLSAREGDAWALRAFVESSQAEVWRFVAHLVGRGDADDVTQDVFIRAWRALPSFRQESSARTWLLAIARRACVDAQRRRFRRARLSVALADRRIGIAEADGSSSSALDGLVNELEIGLREAFVLTQLLGYSYGEAAEIERVPVGTIRSRVARARAKLIDKLRTTANRGQEAR
jgi:RNA polymerase sigma-70 factor, ECF subfamily